MKKLLFFIVICFYYLGLGQDLVNELNGFKLNQFREVPISELKKPVQQKIFDDGFEVEVFLLKSDSTAYMVFEYASWDKNIIWSIQLYGTDPDLKPNFKDISMGVSKEELIKKVGQPTSIKDVGVYGELWEYENANYSFEINKNGQLSSIKIREIYQDYFPEPKVDKIPSFKEIKKTLKSGNKKRISKILSPGLEIYCNDQTIFFEYSWKNEIEKDLSGIYKLLDNLVIELDKINTSNVEEYEENMRLTLGQNIKYVLKFKNNPSIKEIVMKWEFGKYLIWEITM